MTNETPTPNVNPQPETTPNISQPAPTEKLQPVLSTLAPSLRSLEQNLRRFIEGHHRFPISMVSRANLEALSGDLCRQAEALEAEKPLLIIMLMGGTGVGKSTLLNALAGAEIAQAAFTRPTTRDPVVYYHESVRAEKLDPALRHCRLIQHDRPALTQKILVDTPDLDSNDLANREKLRAILPVADIVLYVGSQEKYHDQLGWELFMEQRKRRAFGFVLNKWDRCIHTGASGLRPDEDLIHDLQREGFESPAVFRTQAQAWLDLALKPDGRTRPANLREGEQFEELSRWIEYGLTRVEIEAIKARGVSQMLEQLSTTLTDVRAPDLSEEADRTQASWERVLRDEAGNCAEVLLSTLEPYQREVEHHFSVQGQQRFRGLMAGYLKLTTKLQYAGSTLRDRIPFTPTLGSLSGRDKLETPTSWNLGAFVHECTRVAGERVLNQRLTAMMNRLLVEADQQRFAASLLNPALAEAGRSDWQLRYDRSMIEALNQVEQNFTNPTGFRHVLKMLLIIAANFLPELTFIGALFVLLWRFFMQENYIPSLFDILLPFAITLVVLLLLHVLINVFLPLRWSAIRSEFHVELRSRIETELTSIYLAIPHQTRDVLLGERQQVDAIISEANDLLKWLNERQQAASIMSLYGK